MIDAQKLQQLLTDAEAAAPGVVKVVEDVLSLAAGVKLPGMRSAQPVQTEHVRASLAALGVSSGDIERATQSGFDWSQIVGLVGPLVSALIQAWLAKHHQSTAS